MAGQIVLTAASSGTVTLTPANTANAFVSTIPARTGNIAVDGPAFRVGPSTAQTISHNTITKVNWGTETYDTNSNFASNAFTPTVAGYYQFTTNVTLTTNNNSSYYTVIYFYKNGSSFSSFEWGYSGNAGGRSTVGYSDLISLNGTTDYVEVYIYNYDYTGLTTVSVRTNSLFSGYMARAT